MFLLQTFLFVCVVGLVVSDAESWPKTESREEHVLVEKQSAKTKKISKTGNEASNLKSTDGEREIEKQLAQITSKMEKMTSKMKKQTSKIAELQQDSHELKRQLHKKETDVDFLRQEIEKTRENEFLINKKFDQMEKMMKLTNVKIRQNEEGSRNKKGVKSNPIDPLTSWINQTDGKIKELETCCEIGYANPVNLGTPSGRWDLIQHQKIGKTDAFKNGKWADYKSQFGSPFLSDAAFWVGLDKMSQLTSKGTWQLVVKVRYSTGGNTNWGYVVFNNFVVEPEIEKYKMHFSSVAEKNNVGGDYWNAVITSSIGGVKWNGVRFSTSDSSNNDCSYDNNCSIPEGGGAGWWFDCCFWICLNCPSNSHHLADIVESIMAIRKV